MKFEREMKVYDLSALQDDIVIKAIASKAIKLDHGKVWVTIQNIRHGRSTGEKSQSHHVNGHIQQIAQALGWEFEDCKRYVKQRAVGMGYPILYRNGVTALDPWGNVQGISEADASVSDCVLLINAAHLVAAENSIILKEE